MLVVGRSVLDHLHLLQQSSGQELSGRNPEENNFDVKETSILSHDLLQNSIS